MNTRQLTILAVLAVLSVGATAAVLRTGSAGVASDRRGERVLPGLDTKANEITGLVVRDGSDTLSIERKNAAFVTADSGYPVKPDAVRDLLASSIELSFEEARTSDPARYGDLGLADPGGQAGAGEQVGAGGQAAAGEQAKAKEIILRTAGGELADFMVGKRDNTVGGPVGGVFVRLKDQPQTWLARGNVRLPSSRSDWLAPLDLNIKRNAIKKIELSGGGRDTVTASAEKPGDLKLDNVPEKRVPDSFKVGRLATLIESFAFQDVRKRSKPGDDARRMLVDFDDGLRLIVTGVGEPSQGWVQISAESTNDVQRERANAIAAKVDGFDFRLPADRAELLGWTNTELTTEQKS
jgi:hypothetical protein